MSSVVLSGEKTDQEWVDYCREAERDSVIATIEYCRRLNEAKENISISFRKWADEYYIERDYSTLAKLVKIGDQADRMLLINNQHEVSNDWNALYKLTTLSDDDIAQIEGPISQKTLKITHVSNNSGNNEWYTPPEFIEAARTVMGGINLDPASCIIANNTVRADRFFDEDSDGLNQKWVGRIWLNPPYAQPLVGQFINKVCDEYMARNITQACVLVNNFTETEAGQKLINVATSVCFPSSRIKFLDSKGEAVGAPLQGQMIAYFGAKKTKFIKEFSDFGEVLSG